MTTFVTTCVCVCVCVCEHMMILGSINEPSKNSQIQIGLEGCEALPNGLKSTPTSLLYKQLSEPNTCGFE